MKKVVTILLIIVFLIIGYFFFQKQNLLKNSELIFYGNIDSQTSTLSFRFLGEISEIYKDEGNLVKTGDKLAELDKSYLLNKLDEVKSQILLNEIKLSKLQKGFRQEDIAKAKANLDISKASLNEARISFNRQAKLIKLKATSEDAYTKAKSNLESLEANFDLAKAEYEKLKNGYEKEDIASQIELINSLKINAEKIKLDIQNYSLTSPIDGIIQTKFKEIGEIANPGEPVFEISKKDNFFVRAYIDEPYMGKIKIGDEVLVYSDIKDEPYIGHISFISNVAEFTPKNVQTIKLRADLVYRFKVDIDKSDDKLKQGMPVHIKLKW